MSNVLKRAENNEYRLEILQDESPISPIDGYDNFGCMVCFHSIYDLGHEHNYDSNEFIFQFAEYLDIDTTYEDSVGNEYDRKEEDIWNDINKQVVILPLYLYDHSGLSINTTGYGCRWYSGKVGYIYVENKDIVKEYGEYTTENVDRAKKVLMGEVETYDKYLRGDVYGFTLEKKKTCECCGVTQYEEVDSCWGFFGERGYNNIREHLSEDCQELFDKLEDIC